MGIFRTFANKWHKVETIANFSYKLGQLVFLNSNVCKSKKSPTKPKICQLKICLEHKNNKISENSNHIASLPILNINLFYSSFIYAWIKQTSLTTEGPFVDPQSGNWIQESVVFFHIWIHAHQVTELDL